MLRLWNRTWKIWLLFFVGFTPALVDLDSFGQSSASALLQARSALASVSAPSRHGEAIGRARTIAQELLASGIPGLSVSVGTGGAIVWSEGFGYADLESRAPAWPTTRFRIGSVSKPLTAAAAAILHERGRLDLDAPVRRYVPGFPKKDHVITTRQLAGHLGGIRAYEEGEFLNQKPFASVREGLTIFQHDPLLHKPGSQYAYSTYGWTLISAAIEGASGTDFLSFIHASVFDPLGMASTVPDRVDSIIERRSRFYELGEDGLIRNAPYVDNSFKWAGGGFLSTTEDLVRFGSSLLEPGFFKSTTLRLFATSQRTTSGQPTEYSFGWRVGQDASGRHTLSHGSTAVGGRAALLIYPDAKVVVAFLCNLTNADIGDAVPRIAELFMD